MACTAGKWHRWGLNLSGLAPQPNPLAQQDETCTGKSNLLTLLSRKVALFYRENSFHITQYSNGLKKKKKKGLKSRWGWIGADANVEKKKKKYFKIPKAVLRSKI